MSHEHQLTSKRLKLKAEPDDGQGRTHLTMHYCLQFSSHFNTNKPLKNSQDHFVTRETISDIIWQPLPPQ